MQIWIPATTATTMATGDPIRTDTAATANAQYLPDWAPDIAYIGTTLLTGVNQPAMANLYGPTTTGDRALMQRAVVRNYDSRHFCLDRRIGACLDHATSVVHTAKGDVVICLAYRVVGELKR